MKIITIIPIVVLFATLAEAGPKTTGNETRAPLRPRPSKEEIGRHGWALLHEIAASYPKNPTEYEKVRMKVFMSCFAELYPCEECADHLQRYFKKYPMRLDSKEELVKYFCELHNNLNKQLNKPTIDCEAVCRQACEECEECKRKPNFANDL